MRRLRVTFPTNLNDKDEALRAEVYWEEFKNLSMHYFEMAVNEAISSCLFFPKPSELYDFINPKRDSEIMAERTKKAIEWMEPTEEGKRIAIEMIGELHNNWKRQDEKTEQERKERFERNRERLRKQAKLLKGG
jgi:hypothetical protein